MRIQTLQFKTKVIAFDQDRKLTLYSLERMEEKPDNLSAEVKVIENDDVQITHETAQKLLGLNILPFDLHAQKGYDNFNKAMIQALLTGHKHQIDEFIISITQLGTDFQLSGVDDPRFKRFIKGNQVIMFGSHEATFPENESRIWICQTDSYIDKSGLECVHLDGFSGAYFCKYLTLVKQKSFDIRRS